MVGRGELESVTEVQQAASRTFTASITRRSAHRHHATRHSLQTDGEPMAGPGNLYFNFAEAKLIHAINLLLVIERCDATRRAHRPDCWYSRAALIANVPIGVLASYALYRLFRPA